MTPITFTFAAFPLGDGRHRINMYVQALEPTYTERLGEEYRAAKDAAQVVRDIIARRKEKGNNPDRLLQEGEMPLGAKPVFQFVIGVTWDREFKMAHYSRVSYERVLQGGIWSDVAATGMELYDYTMSVLRKREKRERAAKLAKRNAA